MFFDVVPQATCRASTAARRSGTSGTDGAADRFSHGHSPHAPHHDYQPVALPSPAWAVSSTTTSTSITPPTGRLTFAGHAPTIKIGSST